MAPLPNDPTNAQNPDYDVENGDVLLGRELSQAIKKYRRFQHALGSALETPLSLCDWWIVPTEEGMELVIHCSSSNVRTHLMRSIFTIATRMNRRFGSSTIRILGEQYSFEANTLQVIHYYRGMDGWGKEEV
ncbi:MAG: hypothetical protein SFW36_13115 [Leptolyngbyaceae cyanobacterium bins.59]|nr:hypothetical protein [Leptolyngbyaceae cyanobacterium bins.59]